MILHLGVSERVGKPTIPVPSTWSHDHQELAWANVDTVGLMGFSKIYSVSGPRTALDLWPQLHMRKRGCKSGIHRTLPGNSSAK